MWYCDRQKVVDDVILNFNGSAEDWVNNWITEAHLAGDDVPDFASAKRLKNVIRNAVSEYMNREMVKQISISWLNIN